jgi:uncharacterized damage-inducible protein DinB
MDELHTHLDAQLDDAFAMTDELVATLSADDLARRLPIPSNSIGDQLWCVVGARESWARAIETGAWQGFSCSITSRDDTVDPEAMRRALALSATSVRTASAAAARDGERTRLRLELLVHESRHQGQLLRYLLGLKLQVPPLWRERFALGPPP